MINMCRSGSAQGRSALRRLGVAAARDSRTRRGPASRGKRASVTGAFPLTPAVFAHSRRRPGARAGASLSGQGQLRLLRRSHWRKVDAGIFPVQGVPTAHNFHQWGGRSSKSYLRMDVTEALRILEMRIRSNGGKVRAAQWVTLLSDKERTRVKQALKPGLVKCIREAKSHNLQQGKDKDGVLCLQIKPRRPATTGTSRSAKSARGSAGGSARASAGGGTRASAAGGAQASAGGSAASSTRASTGGSARASAAGSARDSAGGSTSTAPARRREPNSGYVSFVLRRTGPSEPLLPVANFVTTKVEVSGFSASLFTSSFHREARDLPRLVEEETNQYLEAMPDRVASRIRDKGGVKKLGVYEVQLDLHRPPVVLTTGRHLEVDGDVTPKDIDKVCRAVSFDHEERAMMPDTLHRISRLPGRDGETLGLTARIGRPVLGCATPGLDIVADIVRFGKSVLLLGAPGTGKTTVLREFARLLSMDEMNQRVMIVDTSQEIAGDGDRAHASVGRARRYYVKDRKKQYECMVRAVQNHTPSILVIDEIGSKEEAKAAATIRQRGVQLVATVHGECLRTLVHNPELSSLVGGAHSVILSASEAAERGAKSKTVQNRKTAPVFDTLIELSGRNDWVIHSDLKSSVDSVLAERPYEVQRRVWEPSSLDDSDAGAAAAAGGPGGPQHAPALRYEYTTVETHAEKDGRFIV